MDYCLNGVIDSKDGENWTTTSVSEYNIGSGYNGSSRNYEFEGEICEVRYSDIKRSDAWMKAGYYNLVDHSLTTIAAA